MAGWWFQPTPLKNGVGQLGLLIIPNIWKVIKFHGSSQHQPDIWLFQLLTIINHRLTIDKP